MSENPPARSKRWLAAVRIAGLTGMTLSFAVCLFVQRLLARTPAARDRVIGRWIQRWGRWSCRIAGVRLSMQGTPPTTGALLAPNHTGYMDIIAISAAAPCYFVPKGEIGSWPGIGALLKWLRLPFISRRQSRDLFEVMGRLEGLFENGQNVCVFLEGTSSGGDCVLTLRPALLQATVKNQVPIVPVGLVWSSANPAVRREEDIAYWKKEHVFAPHLWRLAGLRGTCVEVRFGDPLTLSPDEDRRLVAQEVRRRILDLLELEDNPEAAKRSIPLPERKTGTA